MNIEKIKDDLLDSYGRDNIEFNNLPTLWRMGLHSDRHGKLHEIEEMTDDHLVSTINYFVDKYDVSPLVEEAANRGMSIKS